MFFYKRTPLAYRELHCFMACSKILHRSLVRKPLAYFCMTNKKQTNDCNAPSPSMSNTITDVSVITLARFKTLVSPTLNTGV